jgi:hypothetical protein
MKAGAAESVIASGIIECDPEPFLTRERELGCRFSVRIRQMYLVEEGIYMLDTVTHTVEVFSSMVPLLFKCAGKNLPVIIIGTLCKKQNYIRADRIFRKATSVFQ